MFALHIPTSLFTQWLNTALECHLVILFKDLAAVNNLDSDLGKVGFIFAHSDF